jgi:LuxR family maltose regulon positive regulatory protein
MDGRIFAQISEEAGAAEDLAVALCERALVAMARDEWSQVEAFAERARIILQRDGFEESFATPFVCAVHARAALHRGDLAAARQELVGAQRLRTELTYMFPHWAVQARLQLAHVHVALADVGGARTLMREADEILRRRPDLGSLGADAEARAGLKSAFHRPRSVDPDCRRARLSMLSTHLSFAEIAAQLFLSPSTIKTQAISIYRKLDVSSRSQAIARAREVGLLEA